MTSIISRFGLAATMLAGSVLSVGAETITYGAYGSTKSVLVREGIIPFLEAAKEKSSNEIDYQLMAGGAVVGTKTTLAGIRDGIVDGGMVSTIYYPTDLPVLNTIASLSVLGGDPRVAAAAFTETVLLNCEGCLAELASWNVQFLGGYSTAPYSFLCVDPLTTLSDLNGKRIRSTAALSGIATAVGGVPVNMTISEVYEGLQRGQIDCTLGSPGWLVTRSFGDVAKNVLLTASGATFGGPMLNLRKDMWEDLTDTQRAVLLDAAPIGVAKAAFAYRNESEKVINDAETLGFNVTQPGQEVRDVIDAHIEAETQRVVAAASEAGVADADAIVGAFIENLAKWETIVDELGDDIDAYEAALRREIYGKL
ncbi:C4-dicarboxylate TRAP transporter substrate-binding protein [Hoeflea poritis]|uniref:C4-dicarboxylate TRAP transporter substrate-binding protein n=1 Tax=Hoeflea poritis TaxID=2993659 RepID=A0ABT4VWZ3_9HYPH|nr:C4-dicarboxylate TRAP transporter substrate-binding protein [Hoeflea poritis]MDA4848528.1 C4-dicarboxylate TRAP transporter substrate-binding protein [Hoeflea poritis]